MKAMNALLVTLWSLLLPAFAFAGVTADEIVAWYEQEGFSGHILVKKGNDVLLDRQIGKASWTDDTSFAPDAPFYIGSVTKQITAAAVLKLEEEGLLGLEDTLAAYFPDVAHAGRITLHQMLTHTSGLKNYTDLPDVLDLMTTGKSISPEEILALVEPFPLEFEPGTSWAYCNTGYVLLGLIVEKVSGQSLNEFWQERFFQPLAMTGAAYTPDHRPQNEPRGHTWDRDYRVTPQHNGHMSWAHAAGGVYASVYDMMKWSEALHSGAVLSAAAYTAMTTPVLQDYGYGVIVQDYNGKKLIGHGGGMPGFTCQILALPEDDLHVIVLTNLSGANGMAGDASIKFLNVFSGVPVVLDPQIVEKPLSADEIAGYTGDYRIESIGIDIKIFADEGKIYLHTGESAPARMLYTGNDEFFLRIDRIQIRFRRDVAGRVTGFDLTQRGQEFSGSRVPPSQ